MVKWGLAQAKKRDQQMLDRMAEMLDWDNQEEVETALKRLGLIPGSDEFEQAIAIWRDLR